MQVLDFTGLIQVCRHVGSSVLTSPSWIKPWPSSSCIKSCENQDFIQLHICRLESQVVGTTCIKLVDKKSWQSTCIKPVDNLQQTCYHQVRAGNANASWYRLDHCKATKALKADFHSVQFGERSILCDRFLSKCVLSSRTNCIKVSLSEN